MIGDGGRWSVAGGRKEPPERRNMIAQGVKRVCQKAITRKDFSEKVGCEEGSVKPGEKIGVEAVD